MARKEDIWLKAMWLFRIAPAFFVPNPKRKEAAIRTVSSLSGLPCPTLSLQRVNGHRQQTYFPFDTTLRAERKHTTRLIGSNDRAG